MSYRRKIRRLLVLISILSVTIIAVIIGILLMPQERKADALENIEDIDNTEKSDKENTRYIQSIDQLEDGEIAMYDSEGRMYAAPIDEDSYKTGNASSDDNYDQESNSFQTNTFKYKWFIIAKLKELTNLDIDCFNSYEENEYKENGWTHISINSLVTINSLSPYACKLLAIVNEDDNSEFWIALLNSENIELYSYDRLDRSKFTFDTEK